MKNRMLSKDDIISVIGMGVTGISVANYLSKLNYSFVVWDDDPKKANLYSDKLLNPTLYPEFGITKLILSPGINPATHSACQIAIKAGIPIYSDFDLFINSVNARIILITGTNGKSTTTSLIGHILSTHELKCAIGGNIGYPLLSLPLDKDYYVVEISSYQLEISQNLRSDISVLLNITPDHLDRHKEINIYAQIKSRVFINSDLSIINTDNEQSLLLFKDLTQNKIGFSTRFEYTHVTDIGEAFSKKIPNINYKFTPRENIIASFLTAKYLGIPDSIIKNAMDTFVALPHRNQFLGKIGGVSFINDSKATNIDSTDKALQAYTEDNVFLILGGKPKTYDIERILYPHIKKIFLVGESTEQFSEILNGKISYEKSITLDNACLSAHQEAKSLKNAVILLSPACASFDQWKNFEERGDAFVKIFQELKQKVT